MKKSHLIFVIMLFMVVGYAAMQVRMNVKGSTSLSENLGDFDVYLANLKLNNTEIEGINETKDGYIISIPSKGTIEYDIVNDSTEYDVEASVECEEEKTWTFDYTGGEQTFIVPKDGTYKLETWGAQGKSINSYIGGYGGYSSGEIVFNQGDKIYINIGGSGAANGGYNGGGSIRSGQEPVGGTGGGATHIATTSGLLSTLEKKKDNILIVSGGGGGANNRSEGYGDGNGGSAGGFIGSNGNSVNHTNNYGYGIGHGGTQTNGGTCEWTSSTITEDKAWFITGQFGAAGTFVGSNGPQSAGGGGFYGGGSGIHSGAGGGSGYIGNPLLTEKSMYCYNCTESTEESTKTVSTTCVNETPTENCAKSGNGYARITGINIELPTTQLTTTTIEAQDKMNNKVEVENNGMKCNLKIKKISRTEKKVYTGPTEWTFDYTGGEQTFTVPKDGTYKLETWGAQGGGINSFIGGYGGYSVGVVKLYNDNILFVNVGGQGNNHTGGYNGGGDVNDFNYGQAGAGATHIATTSGLLSSLENKMDNILIVSGGGGGCANRGSNYGDGNGGSGGGIIGNNGESVNHTNGYGYGYGTGGTQTNGGKLIWIKGTQNVTKVLLGTFGKGYGSTVQSNAAAGGGGGFYGGGGSLHGGAGGGSGYIGNSLLTNKSMYCYNCEESVEESTKTVSTTCVNETPTTNCAKSGSGYARITLIK